MNGKRLTRLNAEMEAQGLDGVILMPGANMVYVSGIHAHVSERPVLLFIPAGSPPAIIIPKLEAMKASKAGIATNRIYAWSDQEWFEGAFEKAAEELGLNGSKWGVEALVMRVVERDTLKKFAPDVQFSYAEDVMNILRLQKDDDELAAMRKAVSVAETAMERLIPQIKIGQTEKEIAAILVQELNNAGSQGNPFGPIVSAGPNGASPHAVPTNRPIQEGDLLIIDWGAVIDDYPSDITRTFAVGEIEPEFKRIYRAVQLSNQQGKLASRPGATGEEIDQSARDVIEEAGYGEQFIHRTGHGLGLEVHENPSIVAGMTDGLPVGAVFTVEPGIYLPGRGGVRIEDDVVITEDGHESLTTFSRDLIVVGG